MPCQPITGSRRSLARWSSARCMTCRTWASTSSTSGSSPNSATTSIGGSTWVTIFVGSGTLSGTTRSEEHTSELQSHVNLVCRLLLEKKKKKKKKKKKRRNTIKNINS